MGSGFFVLRTSIRRANRAGATDLILKALEAYGFAWDGDVIFQSRSAQAHEAALQCLLDQNLAYPCGCSRKSLADAPRGPLGVIYPGTCRNGCDLDETAIRLRTDNNPVSFEDGLQGLQFQRLESESGDFIIKRRDGLIAYQLAVVVDDELEGITEIVRGHRHHGVDAAPDLVAAITGLQHA